ncbi:DUF7847 domain-containing protein [Dysgonomonas reticulitermitis]
MEKIKLYETRDFSGNFDTTLNFIKQNYGAILKPLLLVIPVILLAVYLQPNTSDIQIDYGNPWATYAELFTFKFFLSTFLIWLSLFIVMLYTTCYMAEYAKSADGKVNTANVWPKVFASILPVLAASIIYSVLMIIGFILCLIPGIIIAVYLYFYMYVYIVEDRGVVDSLQRSYELVKGNWWVTLGYLIVFGIISFLLSLIFAIPTLLVTIGSFMQIDFFTSDVFVYITSFIAKIGDVLVYPIVYIAGGVMYFSYRNQLEGIDMESDIDNIGGSQY